MKRQEDQEDRDTPKRIRLAHEAELKKGYTLKKSSETGAAPKTILLGTPKKAVAYNVGAQLHHQEATPLPTKRQRRPVQVEDDGTVKDWPASDLTSGNGWGLKVLLFVSMLLMFAFKGSLPLAGLSGGSAAPPANASDFRAAARIEQILPAAKNMVWTVRGSLDGPGEYTGPLHPDTGLPHTMPGEAGVWTGLGNYRGITYQGGFKDGLFSGFGRISYADGRHGYEGMWSLGGVHLSNPRTPQTIGKKQPIVVSFKDDTTAMQII